MIRHGTAFVDCRQIRSHEEDSKVRNAKWRFRPGVPASDGDAPLQADEPRESVRPEHSAPTGAGRRFDLPVATNIWVLRTPEGESSLPFTVIAAKVRFELSYRS